MLSQADFCAFDSLSDYARDSSIIGFECRDFLALASNVSIVERVIHPILDTDLLLQSRCLQDGPVQREYVRYK